MISKIGLALAAGLALAGVGCAPASAAMLVDGVAPIGSPAVELAQFGLGGFLFGGRQYCWYDDGWRGPGWYWCGYAYRTGYGWGGGEGWRGHRHGGGGFGGGHRDGGMHMGGGMRMGGGGGHRGGGMHMGGGGGHRGGGGHGGGRKH